MKPYPILLGLASLALALPAPAQQVVFSEGFESGLSNWTATGLWNSLDSSAACATQALPFVEGTQAAWYGRPASCNFDTGNANSGTLITNNWIPVPDVASVSVHFWMWSHTEYCWADSYYTQYDVFSVIVTKQSGGAPIQQFLCGPGGVPASTLLPWHERRVDISAFRGQNVKIQFAFGTGDQLSNGFLGWIVDDVEIYAEPGTRICPGPTFSSGCPCLSHYIPVAGGCRNSTQQSATMSSSGTTSVSADTLQFNVEHMPPNASAILTQSSGTGTPVLFGDGIRCISGQLRRMGSVAANAGAATWPPAGTDPIALRGAVPASGGTYYYYVFYRDVVSYCNAAPYNLTETQRIVWVP